MYFNTDEEQDDTQTLLNHNQVEKETYMSSQLKNAVYLGEN